MGRQHLSHKAVIGSLLLFALACIGGGLVLSQWLLADLPDVQTLESRKVSPTTLILDRNGKSLYEVIDTQTGRQFDLSLDTIPQACLNATIATEDGRFYGHMGVDPEAIFRALLQNMRAGGHIVSGGSTLTQQLVRILLFDEDERYERTYRRKLREAWLARRLERAYSKDELLALYLNQSYYGNFAFGIEAAAQTFFDKPVEQLSTGECALLTGLLQYPSGYNPLVQPEVAKARQLTVIRLMREGGYLTSDEAALVVAEPLQYRSNLFDIEAPHFVMYIQDIVDSTLPEERIRQGGLRIVTTLDVDLQHDAETAVRRRLDLLNCRTPGLCTAGTNRARRVDNASAVVLDAHSGELLAMVGSPDYFDESIQGNVNATLTLRQPGSAMKPLTYSAAMDPERNREIGLSPLSPASIIADLPTTFFVRDEKGGSVPYQPVNYDRLYHGPVSVRSALANSYNIPAVKVLDRIGVEALRSIAGEAGISSLTEEYGLALTLGGGEVSLLELSSAFGVFHDGRKLEPSAILDIQQRNDNGAWESIDTRADEHDGANGSIQVIRPETAYLITDILADSEARIPAFGENSILELPFDAAVKTGTTTDWRDNWTIGYSTQRIVGVWVGNANNEPMLDVSGVDGAGPIWRDIMLEAHRSPPQPFLTPLGVVTAEVCVPSGMLPTEACPRRRVERFIAGTVPTAFDNQFVRRNVDRRTGTLATVQTPAEFLSEDIFWELPAEYADWAPANGIRSPQSSPVAQNAGLDPIEDIASDADDGRLQLIEPVSRIAYQIHPALPPENQRILIRGRTPGGASWSEIRLVVDGKTVLEQYNTAELEMWWTLEPGAHRFRVEGRTGTESDLQSSDEAYVEVVHYGGQDITGQIAGVVDVE